LARNSRFKKYRKNSSKGHVSLGEILKELFPHHKLYQEYPLDKILEIGYRIQQIPQIYQNKFLLKRSRKYRADWVVLDLNLVFEYQGEHHFKAIDYVNDPDKALSNLETRKNLDFIKRSIVRESGFDLIEINYNEKLTTSLIQEKILEFRK